MIKNILAFVRPSLARDATTIPMSILLRQGFAKIGRSSVRGIFARPFFREASGLVFIGKGTRILWKDHISLGRSCYIGDFSYVNALSDGGIKLGDFVTIREHAWIQLTSHPSQPGSRLVVGDNTYIGPFGSLGAAADVIIGERCQIGGRFAVVAESHRFSSPDPIFEQGVGRKGVRIGDDCWIGNSVTVLDGVEIGQGCVVGAGAVVTRSLPDMSVAVGVPARVIRTRESRAD